MRSLVDRFTPQSMPGAPLQLQQPRQQQWQRRKQRRHETLLWFWRRPASLIFVRFAPAAYNTPAHLHRAVPALSRRHYGGARGGRAQAVLTRTMLISGVRTVGPASAGRRARFYTLVATAEAEVRLRIIIPSIEKQLARSRLRAPIPMSRGRAAAAVASAARPSQTSRLSNVIPACPAC